MAGLSTFVFSAVEHFATIQLARMVVDNRGIAIPAALSITDMQTTASFFFTYSFTLKWLLIFLPALNFSHLQFTVTVLLDDYFALWAITLMTTPWTSVAAL
jgi:hypothetical protein